MPNGSSKDNREKRQKETHSEIERKRRERMKRETEFLQQQLSNYECRDKISVFQAGTQELNHFVQKFGERDYLVTSQELTSLILNNFPGFYLHIEANTRKIISINERVLSTLGFPFTHFLNKGIQNFIISDQITSGNVAKCFTISEEEKKIILSGELIKRNLVLPMLVNDSFKGIQNKSDIIHTRGEGPFKLIEISGDLCLERTSSYYEDNPNIQINSDNEIIVFKALCRTLATQNPRAADEKGKLFFKCKHEAKNFTVTEVFGSCEKILGLMKSEILGRQLQFLSHDQDLVNCKFNQSIDVRKSLDSFSVRVYNSKIKQIVPLTVRLKPIFISNKCYCILAEYECIKSVLELERAKKEAGSNSKRGESILFYSGNHSDSDEKCDQTELEGLNELSENLAKSKIYQQETINGSHNHSKSYQIALEREVSFTVPDRIIKTDLNLIKAHSRWQNINNNSKKKPLEDGSENSWPDNKSFSGLLATNSSMLDDLFDPTVLKELVNEDVTDLIEDKSPV